VASQAVVTRPGSKIVYPVSLAGKTVAVNFHSGSHYTALKLLEGYLPREDIKLVHFGGRNRFEAMMNGEVDAAMLMEPYITLAEKLGCNVLAEGHYVGSEIAGDDMDDELYETLMAAIRKAVDVVNANKRKYVHYMIDDLPEKWRKMLTPEDFHLPRLRYVYPEPYSAAEFQRTAEWMLSWGLLKSDCDYERLVDNKVTATVA
jgi:NitT/TauT family transport system substrate-binding protein